MVWVGRNLKDYLIPTRVTLPETSLPKALPCQARTMVTWAKHNSFGFLTISPVYPENMNPEIFSGVSESSLSTVSCADSMQVLPVCHRVVFKLWDISATQL